MGWFRPDLDRRDWPSHHAWGESGGLLRRQPGRRHRDQGDGAELEGLRSGSGKAAADIQRLGLQAAENAAKAAHQAAKVPTGRHVAVGGEAVDHLGQDLRQLTGGDMRIHAQFLRQVGDSA